MFSQRGVFINGSEGITVLIISPWKASFPLPQFPIILLNSVCLLGLLFSFGMKARLSSILADLAIWAINCLLMSSQPLLHPAGKDQFAVAAQLEHTLHTYL